MNSVSSSVNQNFANQPPNMISSKDLNYLSDALSWEMLAVKKCRQFASQCSDIELQQAFDRTGQIHQQHFNKLLNYLQSNPNQNFVQ